MLYGFSLYTCRTAAENEWIKATCASRALRCLYDKLHRAIAVPDVPEALARKLFSKDLIDDHIRDNILFMSPATPASKASILLRAIESRVSINHRCLRQVVRISKDTSVKEVTEILYKCYSKCFIVIMNTFGKGSVHSPEVVEFLNAGK